MRNLKTIWNDLSFTRRKGIKDKALIVGIVAAAIVIAPLLLGIPISAALAITGIMALSIGPLYGAVGLGFLPGLIKEIRHGKDETTWKNAWGQTIKSTVAEKKDLTTAERIYPKVCFVKDDNADALVRITSNKKMFEHFNALADKVTVVEDIRNGNGKFHFNPPLAYK